MKRFLVILSCVAVANAGVGVLTPEIEAEALRLWQAYCSGDSEGSTDDGIYCKKSKDVIEENQEHTLELKPSEDAKEQVIFVQPPAQHFKHNVIVTGSGSQSPKLKIFVKPAKNTNEVNIVDQTAPGGAPQKPTLYFLKGNHGEDAAAGARARRDEVAVSSDILEGSSAVHDVEVEPPRKPVVYILKKNVASNYNV